MKFGSILEKTNVKSRKKYTTNGRHFALSWHLAFFNWNMDNLKSNFLSRGQPRSKSIDKFFLFVLKMWLCCKYFLGNLTFALTARTLRGNRLKISSHEYPQIIEWYLNGNNLMFYWRDSTPLINELIGLKAIEERNAWPEKSREKKTFAV